MSTACHHAFLYNGSLTIFLLAANYSVLFEVLYQVNMVIETILVYKTHMTLRHVNNKPCNEYIKNIKEVHLTNFGSIFAFFAIANKNGQNPTNRE